MPDTPYQQWLRERGLLHLDTSAVATPPPAGNGMFEPVKSTFGTIVDVLNRPLSAVAGAALASQKNEPMGAAFLKGLQGEQHNFGEVLGEMGVEPGWKRTVGGLALDVGLDPLNLIPGAVFKKGFNLAQKGSRFLGEQASKVKAIDEALNAITPGRDLRAAGEPYQKIASIREMEVRAARAKATADAEARLRDKYLALRQTVGAGHTALDPSLKRTAHAIEGGDPNISLLLPEEQALAREMQQFGRERLQTETAEGVFRRDHTRENYLPHLYNKRPDLRESSQAGILGDPQFRRMREFGTLAEAELAGFEPEYNLMRLMSTRQFAGDRAIIYKKFLDELMREGTPDLPNALEGLRMPLKVRVGNELVDNPALRDSSFLTVRMPFGKVDPTITFGVENYAFHPTVARDLEKMFTIRPAPGAVGKAWDAVQNMWKPFATVLRPAFVQRNVVSNMYMSVAGDMNPLRIPDRYAEATKLLTPEFMHRVFGKGYTGDPARYAGDVALQLAKRFGVVGTQFGAVGEIGEQSAKTLTKVLSPTRNVAQHISPVQIGRNVSQFSEDVGRLALFIDQLEKKGLSRDRLQSLAGALAPGGTRVMDPAARQVFETAMSHAKDSALHVNKWLLNYALKTPFEHDVASRLIPFYTWTRRIVPLLIETSATKPQLLSLQGKLKEEMEGSVPEETQLPEGRRPEWMQESGYMQLPSSTTSERKFGSFGLPGPDLNVVPLPGIGTPVTRALQQIMTTLTPLKAIPEAIINRPFSQPSTDIWANEPGELKQASGTLTLLAEALGPEIASRLGMAKIGETWYAPAQVNYLTAQMNPLLEQVGKAARGPLPGQIPDTDKFRLIMNLLSAFPNVQRDTPAQEARRAIGEKREQRSKMKTLAYQLATRGGG